MSLDEFKELLTLFGAFGFGGILASIAVYYLLKSFIPAYLSKKGGNLATREDIAAITDEVERVKTQYSALLEELKVQHQLRLAALDRRLQAHQEAFTLWREILGSVHTENIGHTVIKCQEWWEQNCLYLEPNVREAFVASYSAAHSHHALVQARTDAELVKDSWKQITNFPNVLFEAIQLPTLTVVESKALKINQEQ
jgi:hypothetical protein